MANTQVSCNDLTGYGKFLDEKSVEFNTIIKKMEEIIAKLETGWTGNDSHNFRANATAYLKNLKTVEKSLLTYGDFIKNKSVKYNNVVSKFYDILNS